MFQKGKCGVVNRQLCVQCVAERGQQGVEGGAAALEQGHEGVAVAAGGGVMKKQGGNAVDVTKKHSGNAVWDVWDVAIRPGAGWV